MNAAPDEGRVCPRLSSLLAAYADGSLDPERAGSVEDHLVVCQRCSEEVSALRRVRSLLSAGAAEHRPSPELANRLISIAGSNQASDPLWLRPDGSGVLPSRRQIRARRIRVALGAGTAAVFSLLAMTSLMSVDARMVTDPDSAARADFTAWLTSNTMNQSVAVVLMAQSQGADFLETTVEPARPVWQVPTRAVSSAETDNELSFLGHITFSTPGLQSVSVATDTGWATARVVVDNQPDRGTTMTVLDQNEQEFLTQRAPREAAETSPLMTTPELSLRVSQPGAVEVVGRSAQLVEAVWRETVVARWWIDPVDGDLLWIERYSTHGALEISAGYESISAGKEDDLSSVGQREMAGLPNSSGAAGGWCIVLEECPTVVAGLPLVSHTRSGTADAPVMRMVYSDGMVTAAVVAQPGFLAVNGAQTHEHSRVGLPNLLVWQSGETVISVASNGSGEFLREIRTALPNQQPEEPGMLWRIRTGFGRLLGLR